MSEPKRPENRLSKEASAYLKGAAHQPVDWYPWGEDAFAKAKAADKPILLDIGAVWCHWCHVIDHESYEDPEIAKIINERFVPVKVDRDERPDVDSLKGQFDPVNGGFGSEPKFPHPGTMEFLLARYHRTKEEGLRNMITRTLTGMARGGVYDQVAGGFHRYSTDATWIVPHFEKMAYDNATLLSNYAKAWALFRDPRFKETAEGIVRWTDQVLSDRANRGGF